MKIHLFTALFLLIATNIQATPKQGSNASLAPRLVNVPSLLPDYAAPKDTTRWGEDDDESEGEQEERTQRNLAKGFNARDYILETRYVPDGETFRRNADSASFLNRFLNHTFIQLGAGVEKIVPPPATEFEIDMLTNYRIAVGKEINRFNTFRLQFDAGLGYQRARNLTFRKMGVRLDHLYSLSSYMAGYNPSRLLDVSTLFGLGLQQSSISGGESKMSFEGHVGLVGKFFTGPHAYVYVEPYAGMGGDQMDLSGERNWRGTDFFYGVNVGLIYYIRNNLSPQSRFRLIEHRASHDKLAKPDSLLMSWQQPWIAQMSTGVALMSSPRLGMMETLGSELSISVGKWLSPVIGFRGTLSSRKTAWNKHVTKATEAPYHPEYTEIYNNTYRSVRIETMLNPIGFLRRFNWNAPWGFYLLGGIELGELNKPQSTELNCSSQAYCAGVNVWWQPTEGLKLFVEPSYSRLIYRIPYTNVEWKGKFADDNVTINFGIAIETRDIKHWYKEPSFEYQYLYDPMYKLTVGLGGGTNLIQPTISIKDGNSIGYDGLLFGEYHFDRLKSVRLGIEYIALRRSSLTEFTDYNNENPTEEYSPVPRYGLWNHKHNVIAISPGFQANLNQLLFDYQSAPMKLHAFIGPTCFIRLKPKSTISELERVMLNHSVELNIPQKNTFHVGAHFGLKLDYRINRYLGAFFSPTLYWIGNMDLPGTNLTKLNLIQTFNIGVQYSLMRD